MVTDITVIGSRLPNYRPYTNIQPFTVRDGATYLLVLEGLREWLNDQLVPHIDKEISELVASWEGNTSELITKVEQKITDALALVDTAVEGVEEDAAAAIAAKAAAEAARDLAEQYASQAAEVQDGSVTALLVDPDSQLRTAADGLFASAATQTEVESGRLSETALDAAFADKSVEDLVPVINTGRLSTVELNKNYDLPEIYSQHYGVIADGSDQTTNVNAFLLEAAAQKSVAVFERGTTVGIGLPVMVPSGTRMNFNGAIFKQLPVGLIDNRTLYLFNVSDVHIYNGTIDGNKAEYADATEWRHGIALRGASRVYIHDMRIFNTKGDGIYVGDQTALSSLVRVDNVVCETNHRQGMSISHVDGMTVTGSTFNGTSGTNPQAGVDIEPNVGNVKCTNIQFIGCTFNNNGHFGAVVALPTVAPTVDQGNIQFMGCTFERNGQVGDLFGGGVNIRNGRNTSIIGGSIAWNNGPGVLVDSVLSSVDTFLTNVKINDNQREGFLVTRAVTRLAIVGCTIMDNSRLGNLLHSGLAILGAGASTMVRLIGNVVTSSRHKYNVETNGQLSRLVMIGNECAYAGTAPYGLSDVASQRLHLDVGADSSFFGNRPFFNTGMAIGNDVAGGTLGALSRKYPVYNQAGTLLGYVPLYAS